MSDQATAFTAAFYWQIILSIFFFPQHFPQPSLIEAQVLAEQSQILITLTKTNIDVVINDPILESGLCGIAYLCIYIYPILISHLPTGLMCNIYLTVCYHWLFLMK